MKTYQLLSIFLIFCLHSKIFGQKKDSLSQKSNQYLVAKLDSFQFDRTNPLVWVYLDAYIRNAKKKKDYETLFYGYRSGIYYSDGRLKIVYSDSALLSAEKTKNADIIGKAYYSRGSTFYELRAYKNTLDNYLTANEILKQSKNEFTKNQVTYGISVVKLYLGYYEDALELIEPPLNYFQNENTPDGNLFYIRCIYRKGEAYQALKNYQKAAEINLFGLQEAIKYDEKIQEQYFNLAIGIDDYHAGNYAVSIQNIEKALPSMNENGYFELEEKGNFYIAKAYLGLKQQTKALSHFQQVDSLFAENGYLPNELRESYEWLIDYYKKQNDKDKQLYYINRLLEVDNANAENNQYLAYKINKEYDTQRLVEEKNNLERRFTNWKYYAIGLLIILMLAILFYFYKYRKTKKHNQALREQYQNLLHEINSSQTRSSTKKTPKEIPEEVIEDILKRLKQFEDHNEFLDQKLDQKSMAEKFKTNTTYLSKVINIYKETNFNGYINKLRINYLVNLLKKEPRYRNYTIEALSETAGFLTPRHFSDTFFTETGLRPTYFLEQIRKENEVF